MLPFSLEVDCSFLFVLWSVGLLSCFGPRTFSLVLFILFVILSNQFGESGHTNDVAFPCVSSSDCLTFY